MEISKNILKKVNEDIESAKSEQVKKYNKYMSLLTKIKNYNSDRYKTPYRELVKQFEALEKELRDLGVIPRSYMDDYILKGTAPDIERENKIDKEFLKSQRNFKEEDMNFVNESISTSIFKSLNESCNKTLNEDLDFDSLVVLKDNGNTDAVKAREKKEDSDFKRRGGAVISSNSPDMIKNAHNVAVRAISCLYKLGDIERDLSEKSKDDDFDIDSVNSILKDYGFSAKATDEFLNNYGDLKTVKGGLNYVRVLMHQLDALKNKDLNK